jgi:NAD(P)-dependent dehydrogenase (short-subunit alcohol dehydrogenase family)
VSRLAGQLAVVTGASRGIGAAVAEQLSGAGAIVARLARQLSPGSAGAFRNYPCDLTDAAQVAATTARIVAELGAPAVVVQNAGVFLLQPFESTPLEAFERQLAVNLRAPFLVARGLLPAMRRAGGGLHVTIGSTCDHVGFPDNSAYAASKFGVRGLHEVLAAEYRGTGVRCTLISPGSTDTPIWDPIDPDSRAGFLPRASMLTAADVAEAVLFAATRPARVAVDWLRLEPNPVARQG